MLLENPLVHDNIEYMNTGGVEPKTFKTETGEAAAIRLPRTYDVDLLVRDLETLKNIPGAAQPGPYHAGEWTGVALHSSGGKQSADPSAAALDSYRATEALEHAPYYKSILDELECPKEVVRILSLPPGGHIKDHYDYHTNFQYGLIRLHLPIVTHPDVVFVIAGQRVVWNAGELWYGDFSKVHSVKNNSPITRIHMVIDVQINDFVLGLFPEDYVEKKRAAGISITRHAMSAAEADLRRFLCDFQIPGEFMPMFTLGKKLRSLIKGAPAAVRLIDKRLVVLLNNEPSFALERVSEDTFTIVGLSAGVTLQFRDDGKQIREVLLHLKGLPKDLYMARVGYYQGPPLADRSVSLPIVE